MKLETDKRQIGKFTYLWKLNNACLNNQWNKGEITWNIRKHPRWKKTKTQGIWWFSRLSVQLLILAQVTISGLWDQAPGQALRSMHSLLEILFLSSSPPPPAHMGTCTGREGGREGRKKAYTKKDLKSTTLLCNLEN